jgi:hypothetical protein
MLLPNSFCTLSVLVNKELIVPFSLIMVMDERTFACTCPPWSELTRNELAVMVSNAPRVPIRVLTEAELISAERSFRDVSVKIVVARKELISNELAYPVCTNAF